MAKKVVTPTSAYGTSLKYKGLKSNHPIRSRYMAAALAMLFGIVGANQFYLRNIVSGLLKILLTVVVAVIGIFVGFEVMLIPVLISVITGFKYLLMSDEAFAKSNHVRVI